MVAHNYNLSTWKAKAEVCVVSVPALATEALCEKHNKERGLLKWVYEIKAKSLKLNHFCGENHIDILWVWQAAFWIISGSTPYG